MCANCNNGETINNVAASDDAAALRMNELLDAAIGIGADFPQDDDDAREVDCAQCGRTIEVDDAALSRDDDVHYCDECVYTCDLCDALVPDDEVRTMERENRRGRAEDLCVCDECVDDGERVRRCDFCSDEYVCDGAHHSYSDYVCRSCSEYAYSCDACGDVLHADDTHTTRDGDGVYCSHCVPDEDDDDDCDEDEDCARIRSYGTKISTQLYGASADVKLGVELEVECIRGERSDAANSSWAQFSEDYVIFKSDSSLNNGFEIVTRPASLETHKEQLREFLDETHPALRSHDTQTCGLHVHVDRSPLSGLTIGKMVAFVYHRDAQAFIDFIAGRRANHYCARDVGDKVATGARVKSTRFYAVNITPATVELRLFRGTLKRETAFARIEFAHALTCWARQVGVSVAESADCVSSFVAFVKSERKRYSNLIAKVDAFAARNSADDGDALTV